MYLMPGASLLPYRGTMPNLGRGTFVAAGAHIIGDVVTGEQANIWFNCTVRGDCNLIRIGARTNIQDNSVVHVTHGSGPTHIGADVTIGHGAIIHACTIEDRVLIGMGAVILDGAVIPSNSLVAAGSVVPPGKKYPGGYLLLGSPAKPVRVLTPEEIREIGESVQHYLEYTSHYLPAQ